MPLFRFVIEGSGIEMPSSDGDEDWPVTGFFMTRNARAADLAEAQTMVLGALSAEWSDHAPQLTVLDAWSPRWFEICRTPNLGHVFFSDEESRYAAASIEAEASRAPKNSAIWRLAALDVRDDE